MSVIRCNECHATVPIPEALAARTMKCGYCGAVLTVPDLAQREAAMLEQRRLELHARELELAAQHRQQQAARQAAREHHERKEHRSSVRWGRLTALLGMLLAPAIVSVTVFDLPARLGFGDAGADRLGQVAAQLVARGCTPLGAAESSYATGAVSRVVAAPSAAQPPCLRVLAAGGPGHRSLRVRLFDLDGKELGASGDQADPQLEECERAGAALRYEVVPGVAAKGRLTHQALRCPAPPAPADKPPPSTPRRKGKP